MVTLTGTARSLDEAVRDLVEERLKTVATRLAESFGATARVNYERGYPVTVNSPRETALAASVAREISGDERVDGNADPSPAARTSPTCCRRGQGLHLHRQWRHRERVPTTTISMTTSFRP